MALLKTGRKELEFTAERKRLKTLPKFPTPLENGVYGICLELVHVTKKNGLTLLFTRDDKNGFAHLKLRLHGEAEHLPRHFQVRRMEGVSVVCSHTLYHLR